MKSTKNRQNIQNTLNALLEHYPMVMRIVRTVDEHGGRTLLVGGAVRDLLLGFEVKDLDIEVHGLGSEQLENILKECGPVSLVGKVFGVFRVHNLDVDWSLPRIDRVGRKPDVSIDPFMGIDQAFRRRDLTINAMGIDLMTKELIDPFDGLQDLRDGVLRATDEQLFIEDPLRFFRVMQFIGRFVMQPDKQLNTICQRMDLREVSVERIEAEFEKLLLKSKRPSLGLRWLHQINRLDDILPELAATVGIEQNPAFHPEGDVFEHAMQAVDAAAMLEYDNDADKVVMLFASLCHDLGKPTTTETKKGKITSFGHAQEGVPLTKKLLRRITRKKEMVERVCKLVKYHMLPIQFVDAKAKLSAYKRLAKKLAPHVTLQMLAQLSLVDKRGRNPHGPEPLTHKVPEVEQFLRRAENAQVLVTIEQPVLLGRDLLDEVGPGPKMGELLKKAYHIQIEEGIKDKEELKRRVLGKT